MGEKILLDGKLIGNVVEFDVNRGRVRMLVARDDGSLIKGDDGFMEITVSGRVEVIDVPRDVRE